MDILEKDTDKKSDSHCISKIKSSSVLIKWIGISFVILWILSGLILKVNNETFKLAGIFCLIPLLATLVCLTYRLFSNSKDPLDIKTAVAGWAFIAGGALFDIGATIFHSPNLSRESNPIVQILFNNGFGIAFVYSFGAIAQFFLILWVCLLWGAFIRHRGFWLDNVMLLKPNSFASFFCYSFSGRKLGIINFLIPFGKSRSKKGYFIFWILIPFIVGCFMSRWLLGFHWFNLFLEISQVSGAIIGAIAAYAIFFIWFYLEYKRRIEIHQE